MDGLSQDSQDRAQARARIEAAVQEVWLGSRPRLLERVEVLAQLIEQLPENPEARGQARNEAHALAGTVGTFGLAQGSLLARDIERQLRCEKPLSPPDHALLRTAVGALRDELIAR